VLSLENVRARIGAQVAACALGAVLLLAGFAGIAPAHAQETGEGEWKSLMPLMRGARQEHSVVALDGKVYVIGGIAPGSVASVEVYDPAQNAWSDAAPLPRSLNHANVAAANGKIYVGGMEGDFPFYAVGDSYAYDPGTDAWSPIAPMPAGSERGSAAVGVRGTTIYLAGGLRSLTATGQDTVATFSAYDTVRDRWLALPPLPQPRDHFVGAVVGNVFYTLGGRINGQDNVRGDVFAYDIDTGTWSSKTPMPTPRGGTAGGLIGNRIFVVGGEGNTQDPNGLFADNEAYDPVADRWIVYPPMPTPRHGAGAAVVGNTLYVPGGAVAQGLGLVDSHEAFTPRGK
jgi:N-acetylneuraminic acid mutarotase